MAKTALVLGATGGIGGETALALLRHGWRVKALARRVPADRGAIEWIAGDAMDRAAVLRAAEGADAIVHGAHPAGYRNWGGVVVPMLDNSIAAALAHGARLALPGTIYNYDARCVALATPDTPQLPHTRKGAIRAEMERRLERTPGLRALVLRAGDFFGPRGHSSWLANGMIRPGRPVLSATYPGDLRIGHAWAYLPDIAEAFARLLDVERELAAFECHHFAGHWIDGTGFVAALAEAAGAERLPVRRMPWKLLPLLAPFNETMRELIEVETFWRHPLRLDNASLTATIGAEPHTPLVQALRTTLDVLGCLAFEHGSAAGAELSMAGPVE